MKKIIVLALVVLSQGAFAQYENCRLTSSRNLKVSILTNKSSPSAFPAVSVENLEGIAELASIIHQLSREDVCKSVLKSKCGIAQGVDGKFGLYRSGSKFPLAQINSAREKVDLEDLHQILQYASLCQ